MKVMTIVGTRPEMIRMSLIAQVLDQHTEHLFVHTGEQTDELLVEIFIRDLGMKEPSVRLELESSPTTPEAIAQKLAPILTEFSPDRILVIDGSSSAASVRIADHETPTFILGASAFEAYGDNAIPLHYATAGSASFVTGSPMAEILETFAGETESSGVLGAIGVRAFDYFLATVHSTVNLKTSQLENTMDALSHVAETFSRTILFAAHPDLAARLAETGIEARSKKVRLLRSLTFFDFIKLLKNSLCVMTDSVGVQEEAMILKVPAVTLASSTSRRETITYGANILAGNKLDDVARAVEISIAQPAGWEIPSEYLRTNVSQIVSKAVTGVI